MFTLHQLRCFLAAYEGGSFTAAATKLGYAQPSISEQIRALERTLKTPLFIRVGRGVVPTPAADTFRVHAERTIAAADDAERSIAEATALESGTIRFGLFGASRLFIEANLIADVLDRYPGMRIELVGRNSTEVLDAIQRGRLEAALVTLPVPDRDLSVRPVARVEHVYISNDASHLTEPITAERLAAASLVLPQAQWRTQDAYRRALATRAQDLGLSLNVRVEVEDVETVIELVGRGYADSVIARPLLEALLPRLAPNVEWVPLDPPLFDTIAIVHRREAPISPGVELMIDLATRRIQDLLSTVP